MAEYVLTSFLHFGRGLRHASRDQERQRFDHRPYRPLLLQGKTVCVVGAGGIGQEVGRLCASAGMRGIGTRRRVAPDAVRPAGFSRLGSPERRYALLPEGGGVAGCCQWTPETS